MPSAESDTRGQFGATRDHRRRSWRSAADPTPLVGRVYELDLIVRSLVAGDTRLLTLVGPAGVGKTRLALAAGARLAEVAPEGSDRFPDGVTLVDLTPVRDPNLVPGAIARALVAAGPLLMVQAEYARARGVLKEALALAERRQDPAAIAEASTYLGHVTVVAGDVEEGTRRLEEAARRWEALGNPHGLGETLFYLGYAADVIGDTAAAAAHYTAAVRRLGEAGDAQHAGFVQSFLGVVEWRRGKPSSAVAHIQAVLQTSVTLRDRWLLSFAAQATVVLVGSRVQPAAWERLLGAADSQAQAPAGPETILHPSQEA